MSSLWIEFRRILAGINIGIGIYSSHLEKLMGLGVDSYASISV